MGNKAVADTGPILHLSEISLLNLLHIFSEVLIPEEVKEELKKYNVDWPSQKNCRTALLDARGKDLTQVFSIKWSLDLGESEALALAILQKSMLLTDDLDARNLASLYHVEVHGSMGIIMRAFREKLLTKKEAMSAIEALHQHSSLFLTRSLVKKAFDALEQYK